MQDLIASSIKYQQGTLTVLDQYLLPHQQHWHVCNDVETMKDLILTLKIRGAPLIGLGASLLVAHLAEQGMSQASLAIAIDELEATRPTAVNLMHCMAKLREALTESDFVAAVVSTAEQLFKEDIALCDSMAERGAALVAKGDNILTHCNTGALATAGVGTALGVIYKAQQRYGDIHVWVDETRPLLQGGRLTAFELERWQIPYTLICDNMAASLMAAGKVDKIFVGADRIAANGDFANKVGTYNLAVLAHFHNIPFYVVAPLTTLDTQTTCGNDIEIEQRSVNEVRGVSGSFGEAIWAPTNAQVYNPAFDVTPANLVTGWVLDTGVYNQADIEQGILKQLK
ncbi:S-methyl-5-thioribose-1-phosphate isomerase [Pseudoalteromonas sp. MEBiC 03607]|jgi:methylthioribose-1-phosphate isomerase|uniref:S-methyl-5-thioribose-1-phosphate isomerase n=1 Tax=Pseudoalteromonas sp. MEBiC 03607 TaxID=2563601 RepID=UPI000C4EE37C|nr:S-methyl-5-thioribose-1-phosphate isomerase [Pseudoalteromonas sp. MEBiC 03607]MBU76654.1 S-methyl-5-thioribose-1-phosphate isomerase [Pseudoalteromonadaceae bacterium]TGV18858.1 S-methyl-5-thioribose-1-phosphate isomerase [Pseudoalteromonas sp. MEBiC 03607]|tara:strand:- start:3809 stop:4834 length:1026 start_codon:yes stop_codon:yes gene_type:complete